LLRELSKIEKDEFSEYNKKYLINVEQGLRKMVEGI
jgi:hypothetical protein